MSALKDPERIERALERIAGDRRSGASEIVLRAVRLLGGVRPATGASAVEYRRAVDRLARRLSELRPTMIPIRSAVARLLYVFDDESTEADRTAPALRLALGRATRRLNEELDGIGGNVETRFLQRFAGLRRPIIISYSSRVIRAIGALNRPRVIVCESRPRLEGRRTATILSRSGARVTLITDGQIGVAMSECDGVVLGCDGIFTGGSVVNKTGSYPLAAVARDWKRPVIVVGDTFKLADAPVSPLESQSTAQVWANPPAGVGVRNTLFEVIPARLIGYIVMENGVYSPRRVRAVWERARAIRRFPDGGRSS